MKNCEVLCAAAMVFVILHTGQGLSFSEGFDVLWAPDHANIIEGSVQLKLDNVSGSAFRTKSSYLYGSFSTRMKLIPGYSAGIITSYYLSSESSNHDELDFEFLGNVSGEPISLQTNVFANGTGEREERISLWFDPRQNFHTYSITWNPQQITFWVDKVPIRVFKNLSSLGHAYPSEQPMGLFSSMFEASSWATRGGLDKINWDEAPFLASYQDFNIDACTLGTAEPISGCTQGAIRNWWGSRRFQSLSTYQVKQLNWVRQNHMIYDYCRDETRHETTPIECSLNNS